MNVVVACHRRGFFLLDSYHSTGSQTFTSISVPPIDVTQSILQLARQEPSDGSVRRPSGFVMPAAQSETHLAPALGVTRQIPSTVAQVMSEGDGYFVDRAGQRHDVTVFVRPILEGLRGERRSDLTPSGMAVPPKRGLYRLNFEGVDRGCFVVRLSDGPEANGLTSPSRRTSDEVTEGLVTEQQYLARFAAATAAESGEGVPLLRSILGGLRAAGVDLVLVGHRNTWLDGPQQSLARSIVDQMVQRPSATNARQYVHIAVPGGENKALSGALSRLDSIVIAGAHCSSLTTPGYRLQTGESEHSSSSGLIRISAVDVASWAAVSASSERKPIFGEPVPTLTPAGFETAIAAAQGLAGVESEALAHGF